MRSSRLRPKEKTLSAVIPLWTVIVDELRPTQHLRNAWPTEPNKLFTRVGRHLHGFLPYLLMSSGLLGSSQLDRCRG